jgi:hypothetical protein
VAQAETLFGNIWNAHAIVTRGDGATLRVTPFTTLEGEAVAVSSANIDTDEGLDDLGLTLQHQARSAAFQDRDRVARPWAIPA